MPDSLPLAAVLMLSPGPASLATLALASRHGVRGVIPFALGIAIGYATVAAAVVGLGVRLLSESPELQGVLQAAGGLFVGYLGWRLIARAGQWRDGGGRPGFFSGLTLQLLNPKFPAVTLTVLAANGGRPWLTVTLLIGLGALGQLLYGLLGGMSHRLLAVDSRRHACDRGFGLLLILCGAWLAFSPIMGSVP